MMRRPPRFTRTYPLFPDTTCFRSGCICNSVTSLEFGAEGALFALPGGSARLALGGGFRNNGLDFTQPVNGIPGREFDVTRRSRFRSEEHTSELQSLMRISYAVFCLKKKKKTHVHPKRQHTTP